MTRFAVLDDEVELITKNATSLRNKTTMSKAVTVSRHNLITDKAEDKAAIASHHNKTAVVIVNPQIKLVAAIVVVILAVASTTPKTAQKADILPTE